MRVSVYASIYTLGCWFLAGQFARADSPPALDDNPAEVSDRSPVPSADSIATAIAMVREAFGDQLAAAKADRGTSQSLISSLTDAAKQTTALDRRYALLQEAESVAIEAGNLDAIQGIVALRCADFQVSPPEEFVASIRRFVQANDNDVSRLESAVRTIIDQASLATDAEQAEGLLDVAKEANFALAKACRKQKLPLTGYQGLLSSIAEVKKGFAEQKRLKGQLDAAEATLAANPEDPSANTRVGAHRCFVLGDWKSGLPLLAKGEAADLRAAAQAELSLKNVGSATPSDELRVANAWWAAAEAPSRPKGESAAIKARTAQMYLAIAPMLSDPIDGKLAASRAAAATQQQGVFSSRGSAAVLAANQGGGPDTEAAVDRALKWIANHQLPNGSWTCDLEKVPSCGGKCSHGGKDSRGGPGGGTALALLPFLGRGYTHTQGPYKKQVEAGVAYLVQLAMKQNGKAYTQGENLYSQGLVGIALSECYAMTQDQRLAAPTQAVLNFIVEAQDPQGGGWRYLPRQAGDTSAVGWMLTALHTGGQASLKVSPNALQKVSRFLESVKGNEHGSAYGYTSPGDKLSTSAIGLVARRYLGWSVDDRGIKEGAARIASAGPTDDLYYDYYATRLLHQVGGNTWLVWNGKMKKMLLDSQSKNDHEAGSWYEGFDKGHGPHVGGRLYITFLATLILEEYYR